MLKHNMIRPIVRKIPTSPYCHIDIPILYRRVYYRSQWQAREQIYQLSKNESSAIKCLFVGGILYTHLVGNVHGERDKV